MRYTHLAFLNPCYGHTQTPSTGLLLPSVSNIELNTTTKARGVYESRSNTTSAGHCPSATRTRSRQDPTKHERSPDPSRFLLSMYLGRCQQLTTQHEHISAAMFVLVRRTARPVIKISSNRVSASIISRCMSSMANQSIPVVLIGRTGEVGKVVTEALRPEYEGQSYVISRYP